MKNVIKAIIIIILLFDQISPQGNEYWQNATADGSKIYSIHFTDQKNGLAISAYDEIFISTDSGKTWEYIKDNNIISKSNNEKNVWSANIYCSVMQTTDGGRNWTPYSKEKQDHFCKVYLKDPNTGYQTAYEFLNKVTSTIIISLDNNNINSLVDNPQQCTEYYSNENEGWALGWCVKELKLMKRIED